jgi:hypothetical protein
MYGAMQELGEEEGEFFDLDNISSSDPEALSKPIRKNSTPGGTAATSNSHHLIQREDPADSSRQDGSVGEQHLAADPVTSINKSRKKRSPPKDFEFFDLKSGDERASMLTDASLSSSPSLSELQDKLFGDVFRRSKRSSPSRKKVDEEVPIEIDDESPAPGPSMAKDTSLEAQDVVICDATRRVNKEVSQLHKSVDMTSTPGQNEVALMDLDDRLSSLSISSPNASDSENNSHPKRAKPKTTSKRRKLYIELSD